MKFIILIFDVICLNWLQTQLHFKLFLTKFANFDWIINFTFLFSDSFASLFFIGYYACKLLDNGYSQNDALDWRQQCDLVA
jgi:hypothetical protein